MSATTRLYITDKTGAKYFRTTCSTAYKDSEVRNLGRHLINANKNPAAYSFLDLETARIVEEQ